MIFHGYVVQNHPKSPVLIGKSSISTINCHFLSILIAILKFQRVYQSRSAWLSGFDRSVGSIVRFGRCTRFTGLRIDQGQPWSTVYFFWPCKKCNFREIWAIYEEKFPMNSHSLYSIIPNMRGHMKSWKWLNMHEKTMLKKWHHSPQTSAITCCDHVTVAFSHTTCHEHGGLHCHLPYALRSSHHPYKEEKLAWTAGVGSQICAHLTETFSQLVPIFLPMSLRLGRQEGWERHSSGSSWCSHRDRPGDKQSLDCSNFVQTELTRAAQGLRVRWAFHFPMQPAVAIKINKVMNDPKWPPHQPPPKKRLIPAITRL